MLDNPTARRNAVREILGDAMRGADGDPFGELNPHDLKFFSAARVNIQVPILDPVVTRECLRFLADEIPALIAEIHSVKQRRPKSTPNSRKLKLWNQPFATKIKK